MEDIRELLKQHIDRDEILKLTIDMVRMESHYKIQQQDPRGNHVGPPWKSRSPLS